ncbi:MULTISPECIES: MarR family winged helix-turn-helix transcriptional regulator [Cyanophyceae]|uniref:MarR family transcriptional regulator n=1 Tax=Leptolyngbya subtilissima DQ-A4 TaxID=2933933 RepID=A0ABV0K023_9CYAN|nr:MarR family transcriptional regulator [Nodosilinea sp. FACHB-141]MBD2110903.1 MarR family transcriptional regulator [Nodosilinea sp. FACHB-141]
MASASPAKAAQEPFIAVIRELARAYQAFSAYSDAHVRQFDLTPAQFDVIATLGNTQGMTMGDIGEKTLITKGTLTGVVDRLVQKQLVQRSTPADNRRSVIVQLTPEGNQVFEDVFPAHIAHLKERFDHLDAANLEQLRVLLGQLRQAF